MKIWFRICSYSLWTITIIFLLISLIMLAQQTNSINFKGNGYQYLSKNGFAKTFNLADYQEFSYNTSNLSYIGSALQLLSVAVPIFIIISTGFTIYSVQKLKVIKNKVKEETDN